MLLRFFFLLLIVVPISSDNSMELWENVITKFHNKYDEQSSDIHACSRDLLAVLRSGSNNSYYNSRLFFESYKLGTPLELWTLDHFNFVSKDMTCKLDRPNITKVWQPNRFCTYEVDEPILENGLLAAYCLPNTCNNTEAQALGRMVYEIDQKNRNRSETIKHEQLRCSTGAHETYTQGFYITVLISFVLIALSLTATVKHCMSIVEHEKGELAAEDSDFTKAFTHIFSFQTNIVKLYQRNPETTINSLHFIKVLTMIMIILCHMYLYTQIFALNLEAYRGYRTVIFFHIFINGSYLAGTFFTIAGILQTYVVLTKFRVRRNNKISVTAKTNYTDHRSKFSIIAWLCMIVYRYLRIVPLYLYCILLLAYFVPYLHEYPAWRPSDPLVQCPKEIWRHLLFLNNFRYLQLCMPWTWYLAVDFQLFLVFLPVVALFVYKPKIAIGICGVALVVTSVIRVYLVLRDDFPPALMLMLPLKQYNPNFARYSFEIYMRPYTWAPSYIIGLLTGYATYHIKQQMWTLPFKLPIRILLWVFTAIALLFTPFGLYWNTQENGFKNAFYDGFYVAFSPIVWAMAWGWIALHSKCFLNKSWVKSFFGMKIWLVLSNLTYGCYLIHLVIAFALMYKYCLDKGGRPRVILPNKDLYGLFACVTLISYLGSLALYLLIEGPASNLQKFIVKKFFDCRKRGRSSTVNIREKVSYIEEHEEGAPLTDAHSSASPDTDIEITVKLVEGHDKIEEELHR